MVFNLSKAPINIWSHTVIKITGSSKEQKHEYYISWLKTFIFTSAHDMNGKRNKMPFMFFLIKIIK